ncbi:MAG: hypothetical protein ACLTER_21360 [Ruminococcus sp.]
MSLEQVNVRNELQELTNSVVTTARVRKLLLKLVGRKRTAAKTGTELDQKAIMKKLSSAWLITIA